MSHTSSNATGITYTTNVDSDSVRSASMGSIQSSILRRLTLNTAQNRTQEQQQQHRNANTNNDNGKAKIFTYSSGDYVEYNTSLCCEDICIDLCRNIKILPSTRLLFGLRTEQDGGNEWLPPKAHLNAGKRYCFRMRFQVHALDEHLLSLDAQAFDYLYRQIRSDMVNERILELRYPAHKDRVVGFAVLDMYIDYKEGRYTSTQVGSDYAKYLPRKIVKAHWMFVKGKISDNFLRMRSDNYNLGNIKLIYVKDVHSLAPNYLLERFSVLVDYIPGDEDPLVGAPNNCLLKLDLHDTQEPGLKIARIAAEDKLKWFLVGKLEQILSMYASDANTAQLEITGFPNAYGIQFESPGEMKSFITYVYGYIRLTSNWIFNLSSEYETPSLEELTTLRCHGPVGGAFSFSKIWEKRNECGTYLIRQCEKEYDIYYIDINNKSKFHAKSCKTETFKIERKPDKWILYYNDTTKSFNSLREVEEFMPTDAPEKLRLPPSPYDKPPLLLICLPRNLLTKKTDQKISVAELARQRAQVFSPKNDLQYYENSRKSCDNGYMTKCKADWLLQGSYGEVPVTLKTLNRDKGGDGEEFLNLINTWSQVYSPQFIKLYGFILEEPYTMILEYEKEPLSEFLQMHKEKLTKKCIIDVLLALVRGIVYLKDINIFHGFIRCRNIYVTNFDAENNRLETKIADPGYPRPYGKEDLPWIPLEYHSALQLAKQDHTTDFWSFATTLWEIVTYGEQIKNFKTSDAYRNYATYGGILPHGNIPEELYEIMMDGWSRDEPDKRFQHHVIFVRLNRFKDDLCKRYTVPEIDTALVLDDSDRNNMPDATAISTIRGKVMPVAPKENYLKNVRHVLEIPGGKVIYTRSDLLGEGHYGTVYHGILQYDNNQCKKVAIKSLKDFNRFPLNDDFMREIKIMENLDHPNIVKIIAWVDEPLSIIMEYVQSGSLYVYVSSGRPNLTNETLLQFAMDVAKGMAYLCTKNIIHRDLAARNILIDNDRAKISDFGLAQIANSNGYYIAKSVREIPIKWYAPEVMESQTQKYSFSTDVWSYGVTLFEMFSRGKTPNLDADRDLSPEEFLNLLKKGRRLPKPTLCPDNVYRQLMTPCWSEDPKKRPNFQAIINEIQSIMNENGESVRN